MAVKTTTSKPKPKKAAPVAAQASAPTPQDDFSLNVLGYSGDDLVGIMDGRIRDSDTFWAGKHYKLKKTSEDNLTYFLGEQAMRDDIEENERQLDNRIFSSTQTVTTYTTSRITEPEVHPSSKTVEARKFAEDWERALFIKAEMEALEEKLGYGLEDAIVQRRGYLKPRYDAATKNFCHIDYIPCESVTIDHKARPYEEPRHVRFELEYSADELMTMFPDAEVAIRKVFKLTDTPTRAELDKPHKVFENWIFVKDTQSNELDLIVFWQYAKVCFGAMQDPNWRYNEQNFLPHHMIPIIGINVLSDGRTHIDKTSYVEQAKYNQKTIDERRQQISANAGLGSVGMPVVDSSALADDQAENITYDEDIVLELDVKNSGATSINDVFTTWKAQPLSSDVYKDRDDAIAAVENAFGASSIQQGNQTDNNTLGQDSLLLSAGQGRQQKTIKAIDKATNRAYLFISQFMLVYGSEDELFESVGEDSEFDVILMSSSEMDTKCKVRVKGGTSMPVDNQQRLKSADEAANRAMIDPLSYWEIVDRPNAQKYAKRLVDYTQNPQGFMSDVNEEVFDRDAYTDIWMLKRGTAPPYRDDLTKNYFDYLNQYVLSGDLENPKVPPSLASTISEFIDIQLARGQKMLGMAETQLPTPEDVNAHNQSVDEANAANAAASKGIIPPAAGAPPTGQPPEPAPQDQPMAKAPTSSTTK